MRKLTFSVFFLVVAAAFTSCSKDYTCECSLTTTGNPTPVVSTTIITSTKSKAADACDEFDSSTTTNGITMTNACELK